VAKNRTVFPALVYIVGFALVLASVSPFTGWNSTAETASGIPGLGRVWFFGSHIPVISGRLFAVTFPFDTPEFASNLFPVFLAGAAFTLIFLAVFKMTESAALAFAACLGLVFYPGFLKSFAAVDGFSFSIFLAACLFAALAGYSSTGNHRNISVAAFITGMLAFQSGLLFVAGSSSILFFIIRGTGRFRKSAASAAAFLLLSGAAGIFYNFLRPPLYLNFSSTLPPWLGTFEPLDNLGARIFKIGGLSEIGQNFFSIASQLTGSHIVFFVAWVAGAILVQGKLTSKYYFVLFAPLAASVFLLFAPPAQRAAYSIILALFLCTAGACGCAALMRNFKSHGFRQATSFFALFALISPPAFLNFKEFRNLRPDSSLDYSISLLRNIRRDSLLLLDPRPHEFRSLDYFRIVKRARIDISTVYPSRLIGRPYRDYLREFNSLYISTPDEDEYIKLYNKIASLVPASGGAAGPAIRQRIVEGMTEIINESLILRNGTRNTIYYNRTDSLVDSRIYSFMYLVPQEYIFRIDLYNQEPSSYRDFEDTFSRIFNQSKSGDPVLRETGSVYFMNLGEHFFMQDKYKSAVPLLEACAELNPESIKCPFFLGIVYRRWGQYDPATFNFNQALGLLLKKKRREGYDSNDYLMLSRIYEELGNPEKARKYENKVQPGGIPIPGAVRPE